MHRPPTNGASCNDRAGYVSPHLLVQKERLSLPVSIQEFTDKLEQIDRLDILPVDVQTWLKNLELNWDHRDPADRTIVATASLRACALVTSDAAIRAFYSQTIW